MKKLLFTVLFGYLVCWGYFIYHGEKPEPELKLPNLATDKQFHERESMAMEWTTKMHVLTKKDKSRIFGCIPPNSWTNIRPAPYIAYNSFLDPFEGTEWLMGLLAMPQPAMVAIHNWRNWESKKDPVWIALRGLDGGIQESVLTKHMNRIRPEYPNALMFWPENMKWLDNELDIKKSPVMTTCQHRHYKDGTNVWNTFPIFNNNGAWRLLNTFIPQENKNIWIFSFSNGSSPRSQWLKSKKNANRIKAMVDVETNFSSRETDKLITFLKNYWNKDKMFYATSNTNCSCWKNHKAIIEAFDMKPYKMDDYVIRWMNKEQSIIIDERYSKFLHHLKMAQWTMDRFTQFYHQE